MRAPERRAQILDVARRVFGASGYHEVSMEDVAREAGVSKPILYDHFPSKKDLYLALIDSNLEALHVRVRTALEAQSGNRERIRASFQAYFDFVDEHAAGLRLLMQEAIGGDADVRSRIGRVRAEIATEVAALIVRESDGLLSRARSETVAFALVGMVETVADRETGRSLSARRDAVETLVRFAWRGITGLTED
jgi:AcrR family transcriptional regulator